MKTVRIGLGVVLLIVGYLILLLPGPLGWPGIPPMALGAIGVLGRGPANAREWE